MTATTNPAEVGPATPPAVLNVVPIAGGRNRPLRVEWQLCTPMVRGEFPLHLDGLLSSMAFRRAHAAGLDPWRARLDLPLIRATATLDGSPPAKEWVFTASQVLFLDPLSPVYSTSMTRRVSIPHLVRCLERGILQTGRSSLELGTGPDKSVLLHMQTQLYGRAVAYCIGDREEVASLLGDTHSLGGERRLGYGQVRSCSVTEDDRALERWRWRTLPVSMRGWTGHEHYLAQATVRPDYFAKNQRENCYEWHGTPPGDLFAA